MSTLHLTYGSLGRRGLAAILDHAILLLLGIVLVGIPLDWTKIPTAIDRAIAFLVLSFLYFAGSEWLLGGTVGKLLTGIRVVRNEGSRCSLRAVTIRNVLRIVDFLPALYVIGLMLIVMSSRRQRLGDRLAETVVARHPVPKPTPPPAPFLFH